MREGVGEGVGEGAGEELQRISEETYVDHGYRVKNTRFGMFG